MDPVPDPLLLRKSGSAGDRTRDLCICSQKLRPLDHRGGPQNVPLTIILWLMLTNIAVVTLITVGPRSLWLLERARSVAPCRRFLSCYQQFYLFFPETFKGQPRGKGPCSVSPSHIMPDRNSTAPANVNKSDIY